MPCRWRYPSSQLASAADIHGSSHLQYQATHLDIETQAAIRAYRTHFHVPACTNITGPSSKRLRKYKYTSFLVPNCLSNAWKAAWTAEMLRHEHFLENVQAEASSSILWYVVKCAESMFVYGCCFQSGYFPPDIMTKPGQMINLDLSSNKLMGES